MQQNQPKGGVKSKSVPDVLAWTLLGSFGWKRLALWFCNAHYCSFEWIWQINQPTCIIIYIIG